MRSAWLRVLTLSAVAALSGGCDWFDSPAPDEARVLIDGEVGARIRLITSTKFVAGLNQAGNTRVVVIESDTAYATLPFDGRYSIKGDYRFLVDASLADADLASVRMRVFLDASQEFEEAGPLTPGVSYQFVYTFNQFFTSVIDVVF